MPTWLLAFVSGWLKELAISLFAKLVSYYAKLKRYKKIEEKNMTRAKEVEEVADIIKKLLKEGKEVPQELKDKLREKSRILNNTDLPNN
jgi:hypothetical protein